MIMISFDIFEQEIMNSLYYAREIVQKLTQAGYIAYFAGGWVRDYIMGHPSEDIDIATNASPTQIIALFPRGNLVGLQFGVVIVTIQRHSFEVATFRKDLKYIDGRHPEGIELSTPLEDALRRDFTINGMFYDPLTETVHDYVGGQEDILKRTIKTIGNPHERFHEDRLRMLRAFRFEARFGFSMDPETQEAIVENAESLFPAVAMERVWQEFNKISIYPQFDHALVEMHRLTILDVIFPELNGVHLNEIKKRVASFSSFPKKAPTILYLIQLFSHLSLDQKRELILRLKCTHNDMTLIEYKEKLRKGILDKNSDDYLWACLLADSRSELCLSVIAAGEVDRQDFLNEVLSRKNRLKEPIQRMIDKRPLVSAATLQKVGVVPGPYMGRLLKEAEKIAVNRNINSGQELMLELIKSPLWESRS
jgi:poly(A) polymerase